MSIPILGYSIFMFIQGNNRLDQAIKDYPSLMISDTLSDTLESVFILEGSRPISQFVRVKFKSGRQLSISAVPLNSEQEKLREVSNIGAYFKKPDNSDTLTISQGNRHYTFLLIKGGL